MRARLVIVAVMALFLLTGTVSSTACEMMCLPAMQTAACCAHTTTHCARVTCIAGMRRCGHPQQEAAPSNVVAGNLQLHLTAGGAALKVPDAPVTANVRDISPPGSLSRPSFIPPLRI